MSTVLLTRAIVNAVGIAGVLFCLTCDMIARAAEPAGGVLRKTPEQTLLDWGIVLSRTYIGEALGSVTGGVRRGAIYAGRLDLGVDVDLGQMVGWDGARFHANIFQIHGDGLSRSYIGNLLLVSGIEALPATRLYELWIEQSFLSGALAIKVGQQPSDVEFIDSKYDDIFANSALGWPGITGVILPSGGPSPPLAVPGVRIKALLSDRITAYFAVFDGDAAPPGPEDPQIKNPYGLLFRVHDPPWLIGQLKYSFELGPATLPGSFAGGAWYHFGDFDDQRFNATGQSLSDPSGSGEPARLRRNRGLFAVYEQKLIHSTLDPAKGVGLFARASLSPSDRNLINFYVDGGLQLTGFNERRPNDKFGVGLIYARISDRARGLDRDVQQWTGLATPIRNYEAVFEMSYIAELRPGVLVQPLLQYVIHPGGGVADPNDATGTKRIKDAIVLGVRSGISF